jgi:hypothetical protein
MNGSCLERCGVEERLDGYGFVGMISRDVLEYLRWCEQGTVLKNIISNFPENIKKRKKDSKRTSSYPISHTRGV